MDLIRRFTADEYASALESWAWLPELVGKQPVLTSAFGDVFLQSADGFWFLDTVEGTLRHRWSDGGTLQNDINTRATQEALLMPDLVLAATEAGLRPDAHQVLSFKIPPVLGGPLAVENVEVADFIVSLAISGQAHRQVKDLPPGTTISGFTVNGG